MRTIEIHEFDSERRAATVALTALRVAVGAIFMAHGWEKLSDIEGTAASFAKIGIAAPHLAVYLAILGELFGGLGLALGALTPLAAVGPVLVMGAAIYYVHLENGLFTRNGGFEWPLTLLLVALYFVFHGPGALSVDALASRARRRWVRRRRHAHY